MATKEPGAVAKHDFSTPEKKVRRLHSVTGLKRWVHHLYVESNVMFRNLHLEYSTVLSGVDRVPMRAYGCAPGARPKWGASCLPLRKLLPVRAMSDKFQSY